MKKIVSALLVIVLVLSMIPVTAMAAETTATLSFASTAQRVSQNSNSQVWAQNGITFTNNKGASTTPVANYSNPVRLYANSDVIIEYPGMTKIEIAVSASKYVSALTGGTFSSGTVTTSGTTVTIVFAAPTDSLTITKLKAQTRFNSLTVTAVESSGDTTCEHTNVAENADGKAATCTETGLTNSVSCVDCGETVTYQQVIDALGHNVVDGVCTRCGEEQVVYDLVTDVTELTTGSQVVIVAAEHNTALSVIQGNNNRQQTAIEKAGTQVVMNDNVQVLTVGVGTVANTYSFHTGEGYLYAADSTGSQNYLRTKADLDATGSFTVEITAEGIATVKAQGGVARNWLRYNQTSSIFSCYGSGQKDIAIYKLAGTGSEPAECAHPTSTVQNDAVAPTCTEVGYTATEKCDTCGAITKFAEEIPANGHSYVDYACTVCMTIDPESPLTATRLSEAPGYGDKIVIYHYNSKKIMSATFNSYGERLVGVDSTAADGILPYGASAAVLTVVVTENGKYAFQFADGKYLASAAAGNALVLADELTDLSLWTVTALEAGAFNIVNKGATYNGTAYNQALECYNGAFTTFGLQDTAAFQIDLYLVEAHTHTEEIIPGKAPTCEDTGLTEGKKCSVCGEVIVAQEEIAANGHAWDAGVYTEPTFDADGYTTYTCGTCGETKVETDEGSQLERIPPVATVTDQGNVTLKEEDYRVWNGIVSDKESEALVPGEGDMPLEVVVNFQAQDTLEECLAGGYAKWLVDFNITVTGLENGSFVADDCYLAGNYGSYGWIKIPLDGQTIVDGETYPVVANYDPTLNYKDICKSVKDFTAAIHVDQDVLNANPNLKITLELVMTNPDNAEDKMQIGEDLIYTFEKLSADAVAKNTTTGETYDSVQAAIDAAAKGETVILLKNVEESDIWVKMGKTLDLCGMTLVAENVAVSGTFIDSVNGKGALKVAKENISMRSDNEMLPVYTAEGYRFEEIKFHSGEIVKNEENEDQLQFCFYFENAADGMLAAQLADGAADNNLKIAVKLTWINDNGDITTRTFVYSEDNVKEYAGAWDKKEFRLNVTGWENVSNLQMTATVISEIDANTTVIASGTTHAYSAQN